MYTHHAPPAVRLCGDELEGEEEMPPEVYVQLCGDELEEEDEMSLAVPLFVERATRSHAPPAALEGQHEHGQDPPTLEALGRRPSIEERLCQAYPPSPGRRSRPLTI